MLHVVYFSPMNKKKAVLEATERECEGILDIVTEQRLSDHEDARH